MKRLHHTEALAEVQAKGERLVGIDEVIWCGHGRGVQVLHVIAPHDYYKSDPPPAYLVELVRPMWMYGNEGLFSSDNLRYVGYVEDMTTEELDAMSNDEYEALDLPERDVGHMWAVPNTWERCPVNFWELFRNASAVEPAEAT
jgi:hypothetical protein